MRRGRGNSSIEDGVTGSADIAMTSLGIFAILMIVFMAITLANSSKVCKYPDVKNNLIVFNQDKKKLKEWIAEKESELSYMENSLQASCASESYDKNSDDAFNRKPSSGLIMPSFFRDEKLCTGYQDKLIKKAGEVDGRQYLQSLVNRQRNLSRKLARCSEYGSKKCKSIKLQEEAKLISKVRSWYKQQKKILTKAEIKFHEICFGDQSERIDAIRQHSPLEESDPANSTVMDNLKSRNSYHVPAVIFDLCPVDQEKILSKAGLKPGKSSYIVNKINLFRNKISLCAKPQGQDCHIPDEEQEQNIIEALKVWKIKKQQELQLNLKEIERSCGAQTMRLNIGDDDNPASIHYSDITPLKNIQICFTSLDSILDKSGLDIRIRRELGQMERQVRSGWKICQVKMRQTCNPLSEIEYVALIKETKEWFKGINNQTNQDEKHIKNICPDLKIEDLRESLKLEGKTINLVPMGLDLIPPKLLAQRVCNISPDTILEKAGYSKIKRVKQIERLMKVRILWHNCITSEIPTVKQFEIGFKSCKTDFASQGRVMPLDEIEIKFDKIARDRLEALKGKDYNRMDIFGHTDERPITRVCAGAKNNAQLSSLRVHRFKEELENAIKRLANLGVSAAKKLQNKIQNKEFKIYAIGVGSAELIKFHCPKDDQTCNGKNRRIEIRFVHEKR